MTDGWESRPPEDPAGARPLRPLRVAPEQGPRIVFFTGGSAMKETSSHLVRCTHQTVHLMSPFDSGGSSAEIRRAFRMLSVGDLRNRILALADREQRDHVAAIHLLSHRLATSARQDSLLTEVSAIAGGTHPLAAQLASSHRDLLCTCLETFLSAMPGDFDLRNASIGNLLLAGGYLALGRDVNAVTSLFVKLVGARGTVLPIVDEDLELAAQLCSGDVVIGQHRLTGKSVAPLASPIDRLWLCRPNEAAFPVAVAAQRSVLELIRTADLLCFPMGSFYTSVLATLLPNGVGRAIADARCPKVFIPNTGHDPEQLGLSVADSVAILLRQLHRDAGPDAKTSDLLNGVLLTKDQSAYEQSVDHDGIRALGVDVLTADLQRGTEPTLDPQKLSDRLLSLC